MLNNYWKIISRNLGNNKLFTLINVIVLGIGIASIVWGFQNYRFSFSYDDFQYNRESVFRVLTKAAGSDNLKAVCPMPVALFAQNDFPVVQEAVRWNSRGVDIKAGGGHVFVTRAHFTDPAFFACFNFPLITGSSNLADRSTVLITEKTAKKYFGNTNPIGKTLLFYSNEVFKKPLRVSGVLKDPPVNSSLQFEIITHFDNLLKPDGSVIKNDDWALFADAIFLKLSQPQLAKKLSTDMKKYLSQEQSARPDVQLNAFLLEPLSQVANHSRLTLENNTLDISPDGAQAYGPLILATLILLSACLNFANTAVGQSNRRLKEIGIRKVMGSSYTQIVLQQLAECAFIVVLAIGLSVILNNFWLPAYNAMLGFTNLTADYRSDHTLVLFLFVIMILVTLLAGGYPAFYSCRFNATNIFRGSVKFGGSNLFSRILLGLQIVVAYITVIAGVAFSRNAAFQRNYDYGYDKENIIGLNLQSGSDYTFIRDELRKIPGIVQLGGTNSQVGFNYQKKSLEAMGIKKEALFMETGENYTDIMHLKLVAGRPFQESFKADYGHALLINEKLAAAFGWKPAAAIGKQLRKGDSSICTVIGVLKDFTQNSLFEPIAPVAISLVTPEKYAQLIIRTRPGSLSMVYNQVKSTWIKNYPLKPFSAYYQDEIASGTSRVNNIIATIFTWFAFISVLISATGMFALVSLTIQKRMKEIAIRKVVGAGAGHIFRLIMRGYSLIFLLATAIGCFGGFSISRMFMNMIFRISAGVSPASLLFSTLGLMLISTLTIGSRIGIALHTKMADVLKAN